MPRFQSFSKTLIVTATVVTLLSLLGWAQEASILRGKVADEQGGIIIGADVALIDTSGVRQETTTDSEGTFRVSDLMPGRYIVEVSAGRFEVYVKFIDLPLLQTAPSEMEIRLKIAIEPEEVTVASATQALSLSWENNAGALILKGEDLDVLPDDPDELEAVLRLLAGPSAGPGGGQFNIDGFRGGLLPAKSSIREIRINQNPFSSEFDQIGYGRIEIFTKPGTEDVHGALHFNFNDEALNSRNPFAPYRAPFQIRRYGGNIGGPLAAQKASFFLDFERRETDNNSIINAQILDQNLNIVPLNEVLVTPQRRTTFSPRLDYQLNSNHQLIMRYAYLREGLEDEGIGQFSLASRAYDFSTTEHELSISETAILSTKVINETRFQYRRINSQLDGDTSSPTLEVLESFIGGGPRVGLSFDEMDRVELQNATSWISGRHSLKAGARLEWLGLTDVSRSNFAGTFTFGGGLAPELDADDQLVLGPGGLPVLIPVSSIERYRRTLLFQEQGKPPEEVRLLGGGPLQFSIAGGNPEERVNQFEFAGFIQDEWSLRPDFLLSLGLRYEAQTNLDDRVNFAPRLSFAWSPGAGPGDRPKTVIRGGSGIFFDRISHELTLAASRFDGISQQEFLITNPNFFPSVPSIGDLEDAAVPQTVRQIEEELQSPYAIQTAISIERQLPANLKLSVSYINLRKLHVLRSRSKSVALADTSLADVGRVYEYLSDGRINQNQLIVTVNSRLGRFGNLFGRYALSKANSNTDGPGTFPARALDLSEYGRAGFDVRHRVGIGGSIRLPWYVQLNPLVIISSGGPFNITTGRDNNRDTVFTDRPAFASDLTKPGLIETSFGIFDPNPGPGQTLIPRNFAENPGLLLVNLRISRVFGFGATPESQSSQGGDGAPQGGWAGGGHGQVSRGSLGTHPYNLTFSINVLNILNYTNLGPTIGNLTSPIFGTSNSTQFETHGGVGNRRVELQLRFSF